MRRDSCLNNRCIYWVANKCGLDCVAHDSVGDYMEAIEVSV